MILKKTIFSLVTILFLLANNCYANMASPVTEKTKVASALSSKDIDILSEDIQININRLFTEAKFTVTYHINNNTANAEIPLLFLALDYKADFKVWLDGVPVEIKNIPDEYRKLSESKFKNFSHNFNGAEGETEQVSIQFEKNYSNTYELQDLKYFEAILSKGAHQIKVEYIAEAWEDQSEWVKALTFKYSLSPVKHWKSFKNLRVSITQDSSQAYTTNLGKTKNGNNKLAQWTFKTLPADYIEISYQAQVGKFADTLLAIEPSGLMYAFGTLFLMIHLFILYKNQKASPSKSNRIVLFGSAIVPFLAMLIYSFSFSFIDYIIGADASRFHGYYILIFGLYPFVALGYWLAIYLINRFGIRKLG